MDLQSVDAAQTLVRSQELRDAGIYYLEHEAMRFNTDAGGEWNVYGSPVSVLHINFHIHRQQCRRQRHTMPEGRFNI